jgi:pantoate--beta-alanine ligase
MKVINSISEMQKAANELRLKGRTLSFVPTMGFLHAGHLSLMRLAREKADVLIVSIFVNPTQFEPGEDFDQYPRDIEQDEQLCEQELVDILFYPEKDLMYPGNFNTFIITENLSNRLCGVTRPVHFRGVTTIVAKLFNIVKPHFAVFGQKDAQQALILRRMVIDLNFDIELIIAPIIREPDGLAMSSRNQYLNEDERQDALVLSQALNIAEKMIAAGEENSKTIKSEMMKMIHSAPLVILDYLEIVDYNSLESVDRISENTLIAIAARIGNTRLIDNIIV